MTRSEFIQRAAIAMTERLPRYYKRTDCRKIAQAAVLLAEEVENVSPFEP